MSTKKLTLVGVLIGVVVIVLFVCGLTTQFKSSDPANRIMAERLLLNTNPEAFDTFYVVNKFDAVTEVKSPKFISYGVRNKSLFEDTSVIKNEYSITGLTDGTSNINVTEYVDCDAAKEVFDAFVYTTKDKGSVCEVDGDVEKCYYCEDDTGLILIHYKNKTIAAAIAPDDRELLYISFPELVVASNIH